MDVQLTSTNCDEAGDYAVPYVLNPRDLVSRPDNMDQTVLHTCIYPTTLLLTEANRWSISVGWECIKIPK